MGDALDVGDGVGRASDLGKRPEPQVETPAMLDGSGDSEQAGPLEAFRECVTSPAVAMEGGGVVESPVEYTIRHAREGLAAAHAAAVHFRVVIAALEGDLEAERSLHGVSQAPTGSP